MNSQENRELIKQHLEDIQGLEKLSVKQFYEDGKVSGSLLRRIDVMLEAKESKVMQRIYKKAFED